MSTRALPRGIRNNNPGNIRKSDTPWQGLAADQSGDPDFATFATPVDGIRALARTLITYQDKHHLRTVRAIISRWAPPMENPTEGYIDAVCEALGVGPNDELDLHTYAHLEPLVRAIIRHECGNPQIFSRGARWYAQWQIDEALHRAGVVPVDTSKRTVKLISTPEAIGSGVAGAAGLSAAGGALLDSASTVRHASDGSVVMTVLVTLLIVLGVGLTVYGLLRRGRR